MDNKDRTRELVKELEEASDAYYNLGTSNLSDEEFDSKKSLLRSLDPDNIFLSRVGAIPFSGDRVGTISKHSSPIGSQEKLSDRTEFERWTSSIVSMDKEIDKPFVIQYKLDGMTIVLTYVDGKIKRAVTRGDGREGTDVTVNVLKMGNVSKILPDKFTGSLRGEIMLSKKVFESDFKTSTTRSYKNPRNTVTGLTMNQNNDPMVSKFEVFYFDIISDNKFSEGWETEESKLESINKLGLKTVNSKGFSTAEEVWGAYERLSTKRESLDFEIDGVVVKANSTKVQEEMGISSNLCPKGQRCIKFKAQGAITTLIGIELSVGHTGAIVPTGKLDPVIIGGVTVSSALLNNFKYIEDMGVAIGDKVSLVRRGDVIPHIEEVVEKGKNREEIIVPTECPACKSKLETIKSKLFCTNEECPAQELSRLKTWVKKRGIKFVGPEVLEVLYETKGIKDPSGLYRLSEEELRQIPRGLGIVGAAAEQMMNEINQSRECSLPDFMGSLCIPLLGRRVVETIIETPPIYGSEWTVQSFFQLKETDLVKISGFAETKAKAIVEGIQNSKDQILDLLGVGIKIVNNSKSQIAVVSNRLAGKTFCFTGAIDKIDEKGDRYTRQRMWELVKENGGEISESVRSGVTHLVQADPNLESSKTKKAKKIGCLIISEDEFWKMIS